MSRNALRAAVSAAALALFAGAATAGPPALVSVGLVPGDISSDGMTVSGSLFDARVGEYIVYLYTRGAGPYRTDMVQDSGSVRCSDNAGALSFGAYDLENLCGFGTDRSCAHRWSWTDGEVNMGMPVNGYKCDFSVNTPNDISGNGNYIVGGGWTDHLCGPYRAWRYNIAAQTYTQLPFSISGPPLFTPATATRADSCSSDGNVIIGYDQNYNASFTQQVRRAAAWVWNGSAWVETILDSGISAAYSVSNNGSYCVGTYSGNSLNVQRWTRSGTNWTRTDLGRPVDRGLQASGGDGPVFRTYPGSISDDGNTIIGFCEYLDDGYPLSMARRRPWIWRPSINGGVPIDLQDYLLAQPGIGTTFDDLLIDGAHSLTPDGNAMIVGYWDYRHADCLATGQNSLLYLNGTTCEAPGVNFSPVSHYDPGFPGSGYFIFNVFATGSWPLTYQWQKETEPGSDAWVDINDDNCGTFNVNEYDYRGTQGPQLRLGGLSGIWYGSYRCVVTNSCGSAASAAAHATGCPADYNCDGFVDPLDYNGYINAFESGNVSADFNGDGFVDPLDYNGYINAFEAGC